MKNENVTLERDCPATVIPAGDAVNLPSGGKYQVAQALGGSVTLRDATAMYRVGPADLDALGNEMHERLVAEFNQEDDDGGEKKPFEEELVWEALRGCYDPEIPINVVDLGLIYNLSLAETENKRYEVSVKMTLTAQGCGMGPTIAADAQNKILSLEGVASADVEIVWDPPWNQSMISDEGRETLGM